MPFQSAYIEGFHDRQSRRIYLQLSGPSLDAGLLARDLRCVSNDLGALLSSRRFSASRLARFLFHVSHVVVVSHPAAVQDNAYINLFLALDAVRVKLQPAVADALRDAGGDADEWLALGRAATPRVLFYFARAPQGNNVDSELVYCLYILL